MFQTRLSPPDLWLTHGPLPLNLEAIETAPSPCPSPPLRGRECRRPERVRFRGAKRESLRGILSLALSPQAGRGKCPTMLGGSAEMRPSVIILELHPRFGHSGLSISMKNTVKAKSGSTSPDKTECLRLYEQMVLLRQFELAAQKN